MADRDKVGWFEFFGLISRYQAFLCVAHLARDNEIQAGLLLTVLFFLTLFNRPSKILPHSIGAFDLILDVIQCGPVLLLDQLDKGRMTFECDGVRFSGPATRPTGTTRFCAFLYRVVYGGLDAFVCTLLDFFLDWAGLWWFCLAENITERRENS